MTGEDAFARALVPDDAVPDDFLDQADRELCTLPTDPDEVAELVCWLRKACYVLEFIDRMHEAGERDPWARAPHYDRENVIRFVSLSWCHRDAVSDPIFGRPRCA